MIDKYAEIQKRAILYKAASGILRVKLARIVDMKDSSKLWAHLYPEGATIDKGKAMEVLKALRMDLLNGKISENAAMIDAAYGTGTADKLSRIYKNIETVNPGYAERTMRWNNMVNKYYKNTAKGLKARIAVAGKSGGGAPPPPPKPPTPTPTPTPSPKPSASSAAATSNAAAAATENSSFLNAFKKHKWLGPALALGVPTAAAGAYYLKNKFSRPKRDYSSFNFNEYSPQGSTEMVQE